MAVVQHDCDDLFLEKEESIYFLVHTFKRLAVCVRHSGFLNLWVSQIRHLSRGHQMPSAQISPTHHRLNICRTHLTCRGSGVLPLSVLFYLVQSINALVYLESSHLLIAHAKVRFYDCTPWLLWALRPHWRADGRWWHFIRLCDCLKHNNSILVGFQSRLITTHADLSHGL